MPITETIAARVLCIRERAACTICIDGPHARSFSTLCTHRRLYLAVVRGIAGEYIRERTVKWQRVWCGD